MDLNKARFILYNAYDAQDKLQVLATKVFLKDTNNDFEYQLYRESINRAGYILSSICLPIFQKYPQLKGEIDLFDKKYLFFHNPEYIKHYETNNFGMDEKKARVGVYIAFASYDKLKRNLGYKTQKKDGDINCVQSKFEQNINYYTTKGYNEIVLNIIKPILQKYPALSDEIKYIKNEFGFLPF